MATFVVPATGAPDMPRFQLTGAGTLILDQPVQRNGNVHLEAYLTPDDPTTYAASAVQQRSRFVVTASLSASSLVCYNDTVFRDSFDGTGL